MRLFCDDEDSNRLFDAIVIGTGLTGSWAAKELAESGLDVLVLDAGSLLAPSVVNTRWWNRERRLQSAIRQPVQIRHRGWWKNCPELFVDDIENPYETGTDFVWIRGRQVGGRSLTWPGLALRMSDYEFKAATHDGFGATWPLEYKDLAPYYSKIERFLRVEGNADEIEELPSGTYALPPDLTDTEKRYKELVESTWADRKIVSSRGVPLASPTPGGNNWPTKSSLHAILPAAFATGRVTLRPDSIVSTLHARARSGTIEAVTIIDRVTMRKTEISARAIILCASTIESIRLMLNSRSVRHPHGIGNSFNLLGHFIMDHQEVTIDGSVPESAGLPVHSFGGSHGFCIPKVINTNGRKSSFLRGYGIWGAMQRAQSDMSREALALWTQTAFLEVLPRFQNSVELSKIGVDKWGIPLARVNLAYEDNEQEMMRSALADLCEMSERARLNIHNVTISTPGQSVHELGGARMGEDPKTSVLNAFNQCWEAANLFVLDGACFVSSGWQDPRLTMMALAARACEYISTLFKESKLDTKVLY